MDTSDFQKMTALRFSSNNDKSDTFLNEGVYKILKAKKKEDHTEVSLKSTLDSRICKIYLSKFTYMWHDHNGNACDTLLLRRGYQHGPMEILKVVDSGNGQNGDSKVFPYFTQEINLSKHSEISIPIVIREATLPDDLKAIRQLSRFHYISRECSWGRKAYLMAYLTEEPDGPPVPIGYLMLTSPQLLSSPRSRLFGWKNAEEQIHNVNRVVRIARVVVHPEYRGMGIGIQLVRSALTYSRDYWNVQGMKPWLVETVAEMSRYHPFFEKAGMHPFGETTGNNEATFTDLSKIRSGQGKGFYRASIYRIKQSVQTPKPYFWYDLNDSTAGEVKKRSNGAYSDSSLAFYSDSIKSRHSHPQPLRLESLTLMRFPSTNWIEPSRLYDEFKSKRTTAESALLGANASVCNSKIVLEQLIGNPILNDLINKLPDLRLRKNCKAKLTRTRQRIRTRRSAVSTQTFGKNAWSRPLQNDQIVNDNLLVWDSARTDAIHSVKQIVKSIELSLRRSKKNARNRNLNSARLVFIRLLRDLESGPSSDRFVAVKDAFGVTEYGLPPSIENANLDVLPGQIVLISGPSGSGKTSLLKLIAGTITPTKGKISGYNPIEDVGVLDLDFDPSKRLIDLVGTDTASSISILNSVGLTEAGLYLRRRDELSNGQRYRAAAAVLVGSTKRIWIADEFCTSLDATTTQTVVRGIRSGAKRLGATLIVATADPSRLLKVLNPDIFVKLQSGKIISPRLALCSWGGHLSLQLILSGMRCIERSDSRRIPNRMKHVLETMGLVEKVVTIDRPPSYTLKEQGVKILTSAFQKHDLAYHLYWNDLILHRYVNSRIFGGKSSSRINSRHLSWLKSVSEINWKPSSIQREYNFRSEVAAYILTNNIVNLNKEKEMRGGLFDSR